LSDRNPTNPYCVIAVQQARRGAAALGLSLDVAEVSAVSELDAAFRAISQREFNSPSNATQEPRHAWARDISGPQGKSEDQPPAKQIAPAEGVTPPAGVHACPTVRRVCAAGEAGWGACLPNRAFGTLHDPLPLPAYRGDWLAFAPPHRRALGGFMIPTTPCPPGCMWTCRTSTVCLLPR
jgi:hypothetical protein